MDRLLKVFEIKFSTKKIGPNISLSSVSKLRTCKNYWKNFKREHKIPQIVLTCINVSSFKQISIIRGWKYFLLISYFFFPSGGGDFKYIKWGDSLLNLWEVKIESRVQIFFIIVFILAWVTFFFFNWKIIEPCKKENNLIHIFWLILKSRK